jgi:hypothetical protein
MNTIEGYFSIFKRGMKGVYLHCSEKHLHRYLAEFDFRYNVGSGSRLGRRISGPKGSSKSPAGPCEGQEEVGPIVGRGITDPPGRSVSTPPPSVAPARVELRSASSARYRQLKR